MSIESSLFDLYYNNNIQLATDVVRDILRECTSRGKPKMLVFGMGHDTRLWWEAADTYFVEHDLNFIKMNSFVLTDHVIHYKYPGMTVKRSCEWLNQSKSEWQKVKCPQQLVENGPYDIIIIDGPPGYRYDLPGRLLPIYWSLSLSKAGTVIYIDDCNRNLETLCIQTFLTKDVQLVSTFTSRDVCKKFEYKKN
ncbi:MAG: hypothetical protein EBU90_02135 [Proteobacteria bacterium]|nr:hypothetical protein [Pseudomonadota bacterium]NBP13281.1 hypothetical protein [bacterium]